MDSTTYHGAVVGTECGALDKTNPQCGKGLIMGIDTELVTLGKSVSRASIAHRALVLAELARSHDADLTRVGWTKMQTDKLDVNIAKLETSIAV